MKQKLLMFLLGLVLVLSMNANVSYATETVTNSNVQIPDSVKTPADLIAYLLGKGILKDMNDIRVYMETNKSNILKLDPKLVDYGYTTRMYAEINAPVKINETISVTHDFGRKELAPWLVTVVVFNNDTQPQKIGVDSFALVPKDLPDDKALYTLSLEPEYILDDSTGKILGDFMLPPGNEVHLNVMFYVSTLTSENNVSLRMYDGKDHTDVHIAK